MTRGSEDGDNHVLEIARDSARAMFTLIKNKTKFSSYIRKFRWDRVQCKGFLIYEEMHKYFHHTYVYMKRSLVIYDFAPDPSEFPNI
jgi:hypothetical protein